MISLLNLGVHYDSKTSFASFSKRSKMLQQYLLSFILNLSVRIDERRNINEINTETGWTLDSNKNLNYNKNMTSLRSTNILRYSFENSFDISHAEPENIENDGRSVASALKDMQSRHAQAETNEADASDQVQPGTFMGRPQVQSDYLTKYSVAIGSAR